MRLLSSITQSNSDVDRLFTTLSRALQANWLILKATLEITMPYCGVIAVMYHKQFTLYVNRYLAGLLFFQVTHLARSM